VSVQARARGRGGIAVATTQLTTEPVTAEPVTAEPVTAEPVTTAPVERQRGPRIDAPDRVPAATGLGLHGGEPWLA
jgi:hypothetical protein